MSARAKVMVGVFALALVVRLITVVVMLPELKTDQNPDYYRELGRNVLAGRGFVAVAPDGRELPNVNRPPAYPVFLAGLMAVGGDNLVVLLAANCVLAALTCMLVVMLALRWLSETGALVAGCIAALDPNSVLRCCMVMTEPLFTFLLIAGACVLVWRREKAWAWGLCGALWGLAALCRVIALWLPVVALIAVFVWRLRWRSVAFLLAGFLPLVGLWTARNAALTGHWVYSPAGRYVMVASWAAHAEAQRTGVSIEEAQKKLLAPIQSIEFYGGPEEFERVRREQDKILGELRREKPWRLGVAMLRGMGQSLLGPGKRTLENVQTEPRAAGGWWPLPYTAGLAALISLAAWGAVRHWRRLAFVTALAAYFVVLSAVPLGHSRFRYPIIPLLSILAVAAFYDKRNLHHRN